MKLAVAAADPTVDVEAMIQTQRRSTLGSLRDVTRLKASADEGELAWKLILERHIFDLEAELNWLDHIESGAVSETDFFVCISCHHANVYACHTCHD